MSRSLSRSQAVILGAVVLACLGAGAWGVAQIGSQQGFWAETFEVEVFVADAQDIDKGTPVHIRGVRAGQVVAVEYPDDDGPDAMVCLRLKIDRKYENRVYADASAAVLSKGLIGTNVVAIKPGTPKAGPLRGGVIRAAATPDVAQVTAKLYDVAQRAEAVLKDVHESQGTLNKLLKDDDLYEDLRAITHDAKKVLGSVNKGVDTVQGELGGLKDFVRTSQEAVSAIKQDADAVKSLPIVRSYVDDPVDSLVRPNHNRDRQVFAASDLFEAGRAVLTPEGKERLQHAANWLNGNKAKGSDVVVVAFADPKDPELTAPAAKKLCQKQSDAVVEFLKERGVHKLGFWSRRKVTPVAYGMSPSPVVEKEKLAPAHVQIILYTPQP